MTRARFPVEILAVLLALPAFGAGSAGPSRAASEGRGLWIENRGQWPQAISYVAQLPGQVVRAERAALALELHGPGRGVLVRLFFEGASDRATWRGTERSEGVHHFYLGADPARWHRNVPAFAGLRCVELYPGIELALAEREGALKYDLFVAPGADLDAVRIRCEGIEGLRRRESGEVELRTALGPLVHADGAAWQALPSGGQREVACTWRVAGDDVLAVECPERDPTLPLVIDPELEWSTYLGSSTYLGTGDVGEAVGVDARGDVVVTGWTDGHDFPQTPGAFQRPGAGTFNVFATKLRGSDGALIYSSVFGGSYADQRAQDIAVDDAGKATIVGWTTAVDFPVTPGAYDTDRGIGFWTGFVTQLSESGDELVFSTYLEGPETGAQALAVDTGPTGHVVVGGFAMGQDFPTTAGALDDTFNGGGTDGFVALLNPTGSVLQWSTFLGGEAGEQVQALTTDPTGVVTAVGYTYSMEFPTTPGAFMTDKPQMYSGLAFVSRLAPIGDSLIWSSYLGGTGGATEHDDPKGVGVDAFGTVTVAGITTSTTFPTTPGAFQEDLPVGNGAGFVTRFSADGRGLIYSTYLGSPQGGSATYSSAVDPSGMCTLSGGASLGFPTTPGAFDTDETPGGTDFYVARMSPKGDRLFYATYLGGPTTEYNTGLAMTPGGRVTVVGECFAPGGYPTTPEAPFPEYLGGQTDVVVTSMDLLLEGVEPYGESTPACLGPLSIGVTEMPVAGAAEFALYCSGAPPDASGWLLVSSAAASLGQADPSQATLWIDPSRLVRRIWVQSDAFGYAETSQPLPPNAAGRDLHFQFLFVNPPACPGSATTSASAALKVTIQP